MTSSMLDRVIRVMPATGDMPTATTGMIQPKKLWSKEAGSHRSFRLNSSIMTSAEKKAGMEANTSDPKVTTRSTSEYWRVAEMMPKGDTQHQGQGDAHQAQLQRGAKALGDHGGRPVSPVE